MSGKYDGREEIGREGEIGRRASKNIEGDR